MPFIHTNTLIEQLRARLESLKLRDQPGQQEPLFQRVGIFGSNQLAKALQATFATEQRVAFIVPIGDNHTGIRDGIVLYTSRQTRLTLLIADQVTAADTTAALVGGDSNLGILEMKDRVIDDLIKNPFSSQPDMAFAPGEGEPLMLQGPADGKAGALNLGRECWAQVLNAYAGSARAAIPS